jgi:DNA-binding GntR family transcriptional regulator
MTADDQLHGVLVRACGKRAVEATIERYTPLIRRLEIRQFSASTAQRSVERHERLIDACASGDTDRAVSITATIWRALENLADEDLTIPQE